MKQTPPFLQLDDATPSLFFLSELKFNEPNKPISISVRSEDAGEELTAVLFRDYDPKKTEPDSDVPALNELTSRRLPPSTIDDVRTITIPWSPTPGCQSITMIVTHTPNLDEFNQPIDKSDAAYATWWFNVTDPSNTDTIADCGPKPQVGGN